MSPEQVVTELERLASLNDEQAFGQFIADQGLTAIEGDESEGLNLIWFARHPYGCPYPGEASVPITAEVRMELISLIEKAR